MVTNDPQISMTRNNMYLFLTHFIYWLADNFGAFPGVPFYGTHCKVAASIHFSCPWDKGWWWNQWVAPWTCTRMYHVSSVHILLAKSSHMAKSMSVGDGSIYSLTRGRVDSFRTKYNLSYAYLESGLSFYFSKCSANCSNTIY